MSIQKIKKSKSSLLWLQSYLWYSPIAVFESALKIKKRPLRFYPQEPLSWKNLQLRLLASPLYHTSALISSSICKKNTPSRSQRYFSEKGYDGKPSECLSLFAVIMLHNDRIFTVFVVRSGIVFASFIARNEAKNHNNYDCYCLDAVDD